MASDLLLGSRHENIALLTLNRPEQRNALNTELRDAVREALAEVERDDSLAVAVITGNGRVFCAGYDLKEIQELGMETVFGGESSQLYSDKLRTFSKPLISAVNGAAMAGGFDIAAHSDIRIAAEGATFGHPEIKFGAGVMYGPLAELVGGSVASDIAFTGRVVDAAEALRLGIVSKVVPGDQLEAEALALAATVAEAPVLALKAVKKAVIARRG
jgi:enoyl-CoA hydratase/carnithine racemase